MATPAAAVPSAPLGCTSGLEALIAVVLTGKVGFSAVEPKPINAFNISSGETMSIKFLVEPTATVRYGISDPTIVVHDGAAPYQICGDDFELSFSGGVKKVHLGAPPVDLLGVAGTFSFVLNKARPIHDGAFLAQDAVAPGAVGMQIEDSVGIPLTIHGQAAVGQFRPSKYMGLFKLKFAHNTIPSLDIVESFGTYGPSSLVGSTLAITRDFDTNTVLTADLTSLKIGPAVGESWVRLARGLEDADLDSYDE